MSNRLRLTGRPLLTGGQARLTASPVLQARGRPLLAPRAWLAAPVQVQARGSPLLQPQARLTVIIPTLQARGRPLLVPQARLATLLVGLGRDGAICGAALGLGWPAYAAGRGAAILGAAQGQGAVVLAGRGQDAAIYPGAARGLGRSLGDAWYDWFERTLGGSSGS